MKTIDIVLLLLATISATAFIFSMMIDTLYMKMRREPHAIFDVLLFGSAALTIVGVLGLAWVGVARAIGCMV